MKQYIFILMLFFASFSDARLVISEYIEGSQFNKAVELTNIGDGQINFSRADYTLTLYSNGAEAPTAILAFNGTLAPNHSLVIYHPKAQFSVSSPNAIADAATMNFNGDDALILRRNDQIIEQIGKRSHKTVLLDKRSGLSTRNATLRRNPKNLDQTVIFDDIKTLSAHWVAKEVDDVNGLGCFGIESCLAQTNSSSSPLQPLCTNCPAVEPILDRADFDDTHYYHSVYQKARHTSDTLRKALHQDISRVHKKLRYDEVWSALTYTDQDPHNPTHLLLLYSGKSIAKAHNGTGQYSTQQDYWNREHVWAKSHGFAKKSQTGYTDLHHLKPADVSMNTQRSDNDFDYGGEPVKEAPNNLKNRSLSFEPRNEVKGDIARMLFYMDIRYEIANADMPDLVLVNQIDTPRSKVTHPIAKLGKLCTLYQWHFLDPVDAFEINRNHTIYEFQGNRNPFIDHPDWVEKIYHAHCENEEKMPLTNSIKKPISSGSLCYLLLLAFITLLGKRFPVQIAWYKNTRKLA